MGLCTRRGLVIAGILGLGFFLMFFRWYLMQSRISLAYPEDWGHAFVIPFIAGYILWLSREKIA